MLNLAITLLLVADNTAAQNAPAQSEALLKQAFDSTFDTYRTYFRQMEKIDADRNLSPADRKNARARLVRRIGVASHGRTVRLTGKLVKIITEPNQHPKYRLHLARPKDFNSKDLAWYYLDVRGEDVSPYYRKLKWTKGSQFEVKGTLHTRVRPRLYSQYEREAYPTFPRGNDYKSRNPICKFNYTNVMTDKKGNKTEGPAVFKTKYEVVVSIDSQVKLLKSAAGDNDHDLFVTETLKRSEELHELLVLMKNSSLVTALKPDFFEVFQQLRGYATVTKGLKKPTATLSKTLSMKIDALNEVALKIYMEAHRITKLSPATKKLMHKYLSTNLRGGTGGWVLSNFGGLLREWWRWSEHKLALRLTASQGSRVHDILRKIRSYPADVDPKFNLKLKEELWHLTQLARVVNELKRPSQNTLKELQHEVDNLREVAKKISTEVSRINGLSVYAKGYIRRYLPDGWVFQRGYKEWWRN